MKSDTYSRFSSVDSGYSSNDEDLRKWQERIFEDEDLQKCSVALKRALQMCDDANFPQFACIVSCVLSSEQQLSVEALRDALAIFVDGTSAHLSERKTSELREWLESFRYLLTIGASDKVAFKSPAMPKFLLSFTIRGMDASHRTIAIVCLAQILSEIEQQHWYDQNSSSDLSVYAKRNVIRHKVIAERLNICLRWRSSTGTRNLSSMNISNMLDVSKIGDTRSIIDFDQSFPHRRCEEDEDGWVICNFNN